MRALSLKSPRFISRLLLLLGGLVIALPSTALARYQIVARLATPDGELVIDARPYNPNEAGSSSVVLRYRYRGIVLDHYNYSAESPDAAILAPYLQRDAAQTHDLGLNPSRGHWQHSASPQRGHSLYLPPAQFSAAEVDRLAQHIRANQRTLRDAFMNTKIKGRFFLVMPTEGNIYLDGIARLIHAPLPFVDVYRNAGLRVVIIEHDGRVFLHSTRNKGEPAETKEWGQLLPTRKGSGKPRLLLTPVTLENGRTHDSASAKKWVTLINRHGQSLRDNYSLVP